MIENLANRSGHGIYERNDETICNNRLRKSHLNFNMQHFNPILMTLNTPTRKTYLGTFATSLFIQGCAVMQGILLARFLGPTGRGEFAAVVLWPNVFAGIGILGVNMAIARFAGRGISMGTLVKTSVVAATITGALSALLCGLALPVLIPADKHELFAVTCLFLLFIPLNHLALNLEGIDYGTGNFTWINMARAVISPVFFIGLFFCWWIGMNDVYHVIVALLIANASCVLIRLIYRWRSFCGPDTLIEYKQVLSAGIPFVMASVIGILYMQMDKVLLIWLLPSQEIGWYVAAFAAAGSANVLSSALGAIQFSVATQKAQGLGFIELAKVIRRGGLVSLLGGGGVAFLLPWLVPLVYGIEFQPATYLAIILLPGVLVSGLGEIINQALRGQGRPIATVFPKLFGLIVMALIGVALVDIFGGRGIACAYLVAELIAFIGILFVAIKYFQDSSWLALCPNKDDVRFLLSRCKKVMQTIKAGGNYE